ncbi:LysR family transcriptional regulator [Calidifontimicrobium sp. SYSU G02091]|uniref:LysR family transcriptional regulator n=1 Tax=Calidifontimicrobium sp. SYSU G02091 TaxID=2926421 RepID=UPI001F52C51F|nr:LysR family transcriptional regulator [Calidifontimicrobium sp. SYSU G02091]
MDRWTEIELFVQVAELGSLSRAAESLGLSNAAASRHLASLEARLAARLVQRNTRRLFLTDVGEAFYRRCKPLLGELRDAESAVNEAVLKPTGLLRVTASLSFSMIVIAPLLPEFHARYPELKVEIVVSNRYTDLLESGIDVAIRNREFENDSAITVRRLAETKRVLAASPQYLQRHGMPRTPDELAQHRLLIYNLANQPHQLRFTRNGAVTTVPIDGLLEANDGQVIRAAALKHLGILIQPMYIIHEDVVAGRLVPLLQDWELPRLTINIAYPTRRHLPAKVRCFVDFLVEQFERLDYERRWTA